MGLGEKDIDNFAVKIEDIQREIQKGIIGQTEVIRQVLLAVLCGGNVLLEGVPGLGKTRLVKTLGHVLDLQFSRIQFTPDLMPADITGTNIIVDKGGFKFQQGPIFSNIVLADEINRATPKTQSALLEAMQEHTVTVAGTTYELPKPYFVLATQNPLEQEGTYPLPEAQLDRFLFKITVDFPKLDELHDIINLTTTGDEVYINKMADGNSILHMKGIGECVPVAFSVQDYALKLVLATHPEYEGAPEVTKEYVRYGSSPRGAQAIVSAARINALMEGRLNVSFDDIRYVAYPALRHRIFLNFDGLAKGRTSDDILAEIIQGLDE
ncbi:MAG: MoxR family ATPase [Xylanivirga thermophila]|jgi:MoxR-like ATPase|uniref:AAA family ATPase n=1 Tax=Xylanivirga thermophila TaxID=2496273 RepID=UPI0039F46789